MKSPQEVIRRKRDGYELAEAEIEAFFNGFLKGHITDYQVAAMLMAITFRGMSTEETATLTRISRDSGKVFSWPFPKNLVVDKHSTGGVGDKTSLIILPLAVLAGLKVPMIAGRGLGHTGGTLDKLESIPGMQVFLKPEVVERQVRELGGVIIGQTESIATLDRHLYALRDVTATVESIPLITASILSKKLAEGLGSLVMDVKFGSGAFMQQVDDARALAKNLVLVGSSLGLNTVALLTNMNSPLGTNAGNALEVLESLEVLSGQGPNDTRELSLSLAIEMVQTAFPSRTKSDIRAELTNYLDSGEALEMFLRILRAQGAETKSLAINGKGLTQAKHVIELKSTVNGYISSWNVRELGLAVLQLGGGRTKVSDRIDHSVGLTGLKRVGTKVTIGDPLVTIHCNDEHLAKPAGQTILQALTISDEAKAVDELILERIT